MTKKNGGDPPIDDAGVAKAVSERSAKDGVADGDDAKPRSRIRQVLGELSAQRQVLNSLDTEISELVKRVEVAMRKHFSVRIEKMIDSTFEQGTEWFQALAFGKWDSRWQLLIVEGLVDEPDSYRTTPLVSAPRETRASMFRDGHIEGLILSAVKQLDEQIDGRKEALVAGKTIIDDLDTEASL